MQLFARFFRPSGALFGTSAVGDKARRASDRPWTGRAHRSTGRCSAVTGPKRPMPTGSVVSPNGWRPACRGMRRLGARLPSCAIRSSDRSCALRITADRTALSKERATAHPDRRGGRWAGIPAKPGDSEIIRPLDGPAGQLGLGDSDNADMSDHPDNRHRAYRRSCPSMYVQQMKQMIFASASLHRFSAGRKLCRKRGYGPCAERRNAPDAGVGRVVPVGARSLFKRIGRVRCVGFHSYQVVRNRKTMKKYPKYCIFENLSLYFRCSYMYEQIYMIQT